MPPRTFFHSVYVPCNTMVAQLIATGCCAGGQHDEWAAEGGVAPPIPPGTTLLLDDVLHVDMHAFCHKFLADGVCTPPLCLGPVPSVWCTTQQHCMSAALWLCLSYCTGFSGLPKQVRGRGLGDGGNSECGYRCNHSDSTRMCLQTYELSSATRTVILR